MKNPIANLWLWLDGKKTNIGAMCLLLVTFITQVVIGIWKYDPLWIDNAAQTLSWIGGALVSAGMGHQLVKNATPK